MKKIYLAGGGGLGVEYAHQWRNEATDMLFPLTSISPFRGGKIERAYKEGHYQGRKVFTPNEILIRDLNDIKESSGILAEMRCEEYNYIGTSAEIFFAGRILQIPVVVWTTPKYEHHPWLVANSVKIFTGDLKEVCDYFKEYFCIRE